jgi:hypothetical protein
VPGLGTDANADVWISIGGLFSFQPGELAKIAFAIFFAGYLVRTREALTSVGTRFLGMTWPRARELGPLLLSGSPRWRSSSPARPRHGMLIFGMFVAMLYVATGKTSWACSVCCWPSAAPDRLAGPAVRGQGASRTG